MMRRNFLTVTLLLIITTGISGQEDGWRKLIPLESTRDEVEKIIGKPNKYFETYGRYEKEFGKFSVWYSKGGCHKDIEGLQYNIPAGKMTRLLVYLNRFKPIENFISNKDSFKREESPAKNNRYFYTSPDEKIIFQIVPFGNGVEMVYSIGLQPSKDKQHLLCKESEERKSEAIKSQ